MPAPPGRRGLGHRTVGCDRASDQQAAEGRIFDPDLRSGLCLSHSAAIDANPATCRPVARRRHRVVFGGELSSASLCPGRSARHGAHECVSSGSGSGATSATGPSSMRSTTPSTATALHATLIARARSLPAWMQLLHPFATLIAKSKLLVLPVYPAAWPQAKQHPV